MTFAAFNQSPAEVVSLAVVALFKNSIAHTIFCYSSGRSSIVFGFRSWLTRAGKQQPSLKALTKANEQQFCFSLFVPSFVPSPLLLLFLLFFFFRRPPFLSPTHPIYPFLPSSPHSVRGTKLKSSKQLSHFLKDILLTFVSDVSPFSTRSGH